MPNGMAVLAMGGDEGRRCLQVAYLPNGCNGVRSETLEEQELKGEDSRKLQVGGGILQPAASHAL